MQANVFSYQYETHIITVVGVDYHTSYNSAYYNMKVLGQVVK